MPEEKKLFECAITVIDGENEYSDYWIVEAENSTEADLLIFDHALKEHDIEKPNWLKDSKRIAWCNDGIRAFKANVLMETTPEEFFERHKL